MRKRITAYLIAVALISTKPVSAQVNWTGVSSNAWTNASNWNPMNVPDVALGVAGIHQAIVGPNASNRTASTGTGNIIEIATLQVMSGGRVEVSGSSAIEVYAGGSALQVQGVVEFANTAEASRLGIATDTTLSGGGEIFLRRNGHALRGVTSSLAPLTERLTNTDVLIHGVGRVGGDSTSPESMHLTNRGQIVADVSLGVLQIEASPDADAVVNSGMLIARNGGVLALGRINIGSVNLPVRNVETVGGTVI